jgi:hypothetical protein
MKNKHSFYTAALAGLLAFTMAAAGEQVVPGAGGGDNNAHVDRILRGGFPEVQSHLKGLAEKLGLSDGQTARIRPILEELHDALQRISQDPGLAGEASHARLRGAFETADRKIRECLDANQKRKLDELEREMHSQLSEGSGGSAGPGPGELGHGAPKVEQHLKLLAGKLGLSAEQQRKAKPILQEMHDALDKIVQAGEVSSGDLQNQMKLCREQADRKLRELLDDGQKLKLNDLERAAHSELHEGLKGAGAGPAERPGE